MSEQKYYGIYQGIVTTNDDPNKRGRIKTKCPTVLGSGESAWCDPVIPVAYDGGGDFCIPQRNEAVWIMFIEGDVNRPVWLGGWWSNYKTPLGNNYVGIEGIRIINFGDSSILMQNGNITLISKGNSAISISENVVQINGTLLSNDIENLRTILYNGRRITPLDKMSFNGNTYIDTLFKPTNSSRIEVEFSYNTLNSFVFGSRTSNSSEDMFSFLCNTTKIYPRFGTFGSYISNSLITTEQRHTITLSQEGVYIDNQVVKDDYNTMDFTSTHNIYVGALNVNSTSIDSKVFDGYIYSVKLWEDNVFKKHLIPVLIETQECMYDRLNDVFYRPKQVTENRGEINE